jgi:hypothetical protein
MEGKQKIPSNGPESAARKSCGTTMRRLLSSCFSNVERNTPLPLFKPAAGRPATIAPAEVG